MEALGLHHRLGPRRQRPIFARSDTVCAVEKAPGFRWTGDGVRHPFVAERAVDVIFLGDSDNVTSVSEGALVTKLAVFMTIELDESEFGLRALGPRGRRLR